MAFVCCRALEMRQEERFLHLLGLSLPCRGLQIHFAELWRWFCWVYFLWAWWSLRAADLARAHSFCTLATGTLLYLKITSIFLSRAELGWGPLCLALASLDPTSWVPLRSFHILNLNLDLLWLTLLALEPIQIIQMIVLVHNQINLG